MIKCYLCDEYERFVTENHPLIYSFLRSRRLDEAEYYDVVVFGFLKAADAYLSKPELRRQYKFSTIARTKMGDEIFKYYEKQTRLKRKGVTISLDALTDGGDECLSLLSVPDSGFMDFETKLLKLELASRVSKRDMRVIRMKNNGYSTKEIAKDQKMTIKAVRDLLNSLYEVVWSVCYD